MVQLLPDFERNSVRRGFKILPSFIVMNFAEREWSMCSVNWISRGPEAWVQTRSTSTVWRPSAVKDTKQLPCRRKCWKSCNWGESFQVPTWTGRLQHLFGQRFRYSFYVSTAFWSAKQTNQKKLLYWRHNNNLQFCWVQEKSLSAEGGIIPMRSLCQKKTLPCNRTSRDFLPKKGVCWTRKCLVSHRWVNPQPVVCEEEKRW